jgi:hypothetical protein
VWPIEAKKAAGRFRQHGIAEREAADVGRIGRNQHRVEVEFLHRGQQDRWVVMAGNSQMTYTALDPGL